MKGFSFSFRRLAKWQKRGTCAMRSLDEGKVTRCRLPGAVQFEGTYQVPRGPTKTDRIVYCETRGSAVARLYNAKIEAADDAA